MCTFQIGDITTGGNKRYAFTVARGDSSTLSTNYINLASNAKLGGSDVQLVTGNLDRTTSLATAFIITGSDPVSSTSVTITYVDNPGIPGTYYYAVRGVSSDTTSNVTQFKFYALNIS